MPHEKIKTYNILSYILFNALMFVMMAFSINLLDELVNSQSLNHRNWWIFSALMAFSIVSVVVNIKFLVGRFDYGIMSCVVVLLLTAFLHLNFFMLLFVKF